jgi:hypothetical protein
MKERNTKNEAAEEEEEEEEEEESPTNERKSCSITLAIILSYLTTCSWGLNGQYC